MNEIVVGQRWVVDSEPELGLGIVVDLDARSVTLFFECGESERRYSTHQAPLTRVRFEVDDEIQKRDGSFHRVHRVIEQDGLLLYDVGTKDCVIETAIASEIQINQPLMRLLIGQVESPKWFSFRRQLDHGMGNWWRSRMGGLMGVRANLIPHQVYIAWTACQQEHVRVLLADQVGLGKTVEAGMILNRLLKFERVSRALIVVPDALQVQWLVELVRKFSIAPDLYSGREHDFMEGQIHILPQSQLANESKKLLEGEFDMILVDEAHHIEPQVPEFDCLQALSRLCKHMVLLTATPEQLGVENHFARLQLLDPAKYSGLKAYLNEEENFSELNSIIKKLPESKPKLLEAYNLDDQLDSEHLLDQVLDLYGVGRVMFRNVRSAIKGFPGRRLLKYELASDEDEQKFEWLAQFLKEDIDRKALVICHELSAVKKCEQYLWKKHGLDTALFHEEQDLIERDRAAAYFADPDQGSQTLICSEMGSEGRNFQFCHHLICLDLPDNPDLLEQRIGRLDRIGQIQDVSVHVPYGEGSRAQVLLDWYDLTLGCITRLNPAAGKVHRDYWQRFLAGEDVQAQAKREVESLLKKIEGGRDALLELNSCRQPQANQLVDDIEAASLPTPMQLVENASELLQFHFEGLGGGIYSLLPSDKMLVPSLPGIPPEGTELTFDRNTACEREDLMFLSWDSPFLSGLWELIHHSELGCASVATLPTRKLPAGHCLLECCFDFIVQHKRSLDCMPFLPEHSVRVLLLDVGEKNLAETLPEAQLQKNLQAVPKKLAREIIKARKTEISQWFKKATVLAEESKRQLVERAVGEVEAHFDTEHSRIIRLAAIHRENSEGQELEALKEDSQGILEALSQHAQLQLSAIRLVVVAPPQ